MQKEADALATAGYDVSVVSAHYFGWTIPLDDAIARKSPWRSVSYYHHKKAVLPGIRHYILRVRLVLCRKLYRHSKAFLIPEFACSPVFLEHLVIAIRLKADLYIGHNLQSLPVVCLAARLSGALCAFDSEDLHCGELEDGLDEHPDQHLAKFIQKKYLRKCKYVTASSPGIGEELTRRYGIPKPTTVFNTFAHDSRLETGSVQNDRLGGSESVSFYWFSQIVGLDRGLQDAVAAIGKVGNNAELHIRGKLDASVKAYIESLALESGSSGRVFFHEPVSPEKLICHARQHDVGLCLETTKSVNHDLCIANKLFIYMLSGLALVATRTSGQSEVFRKTPGIGYLYDEGDVDQLAHVMDRIFNDRNDLQTTKENAYFAAKGVWNWSNDEQRLLDCVDAAFSA